MRKTEYSKVEAIPQQRIIIYEVVYDIFVECLEVFGRENLLP